MRHVAVFQNGRRNDSALQLVGGRDWLRMSVHRNGLDHRRDLQVGRQERLNLRLLEHVLRWLRREPDVVQG